MPNTNSAKKRLKQNKVQRLRNRAARSVVRKAVKKVRTAAEAGDVATAETEFIAAAKTIDRASTQRLIHPNTGARTKSRLQALIKKVKQGAAT